MLLSSKNRQLIYHCLGATDNEEDDPTWVPSMEDVEQILYDQEVSAEESEDFAASEEIRKST